MIFSRREIFQEVLITLRNPREGGERMLNQQIPDGAVWPFFALSVVLSTLGAEVNALLNPPEPGIPVVYIAPLLLVILLFIVNATMAAGLAGVGRGFGGKGGFRDAVILMSWQQFIWFFGLLLVSGLGLLIPMAAGVLSMAFAVILIWVMVSFTAALHGFTSMWVATFVMILAALGAAVVMVILFSVFAVSVGGVVGT